MALITSIISSLVVKAVSPIIDKQVKGKQSHAIKKHNELGFVEGAFVLAIKGPQSGRMGVIEEVKHLWLILEDGDGDRYRLFVSNCRVTRPPRGTETVPD